MLDISERSWIQVWKGTEYLLNIESSDTFYIQVWLGLLLGGSGIEKKTHAGSIFFANLKSTN